MNFKHAMVMAVLMLAGCSAGRKATESSSATSVRGTWKLVESFENGSHRVYAEEGQEAVRIFNATHYSYFRHSTTDRFNTLLAAGSGTYKQDGNDYEENLIYCNVGIWEKQHFIFKLKFNGDTMRMISPRFSTEDVFVRIAK